MSNINGPKPQFPLKSLINLYNNDPDKSKIEEEGIRPLILQEVNSDS